MPVGSRVFFLRVRALLVAVLGREHLLHVFAVAVMLANARVQRVLRPHLKRLLHHANVQPASFLALHGVLLQVAMLGALIAHLRQLDRESRLFAHLSNALPQLLVQLHVSLPSRRPLVADGLVFLNSRGHHVRLVLRIR